MFELNQEIDKWREHLTQTKSLKEEDAQEIKSHLIDSVIDLVENGLSQEEAFFIAKHRIGDVSALNTEYAKVNTGHIWRSRFMWLMTGYFLFGSLPIAVQILSQFIHAFDIKLLLYPSTLIWGTGYSSPYVIFIGILLTVGLIMYLLMREKESRINRLFALRSGTKLVFSLIVLYVGLVVLQMVGWQFLHTAELAGNAAQSGVLFELIWECSLVFFLLFIVFSHRQQSQHRFRLA